MTKRLIILLFAAVLLLLAACGGGGEGDPAQTVEQYLQAKTTGDAETIRALLCADMEQFLERETRTFDSVSGVQIQDMACTRDGSSDVVRCQGKIVATYGTEDTEFPLTNYRVVQEDGEWKWCGEAE
ncbi:MAG: nuclear transport factor 2 family protein [Chloroflexi bacterium]|nr:nuclear transport factor 2 family protein [Chloroflexota bacterium]